MHPEISSNDNVNFFYFLIPPFTLSSSQVQWNVIDGVTGESGEDTFLFRFDGQTYNL